MTAYEPAANRYDDMPYRRCGRSGLVLPAVSLGYWQNIGAAGNEDLCRQATYYAFDHGVTHLDLANNYGPPPGSAEQMLGKVLKNMPRDELILSTKAGYRHWPGPYGDGGSRKYLIASLDQSLRRLGVDYVDIFYHHRPDPNTPMEESLAALDQIVRQGKAIYVGVSSYSGVQFRQAAEIVARNGWAPLTIHQPCFNMIQNGVKRDLLPHTDAAGTGVIAFCPLAQGILTDKYLNGLPDNSRRGRRGDEGRKWYKQQAAQGTWEKVGKLNEIAKRRGQSLAQMALSWLLSDERLTSVVIGISRIEQLAENIDAAKAPALTDEELTEIENILEGRA